MWLVSALFPLLLILGVVAIGMGGVAVVAIVKYWPIAVGVVLLWIAVTALSKSTAPRFICERCGCRFR
jgi:hypothetical protein